MYELPLQASSVAGGLLAQAGMGESLRAQADVFEEIFFVFLALGTLVGIVVVSYTLYNAYKYRETGDGARKDFDPPVVGELPTGQQSGKGKKLFLSFGLSAVLVISLVVYSYGLLLYVEDGPAEDAEEQIEIQVEGYQFGWAFIYPNGHEVQSELRVPADTRIQLQVTSRDVWHNFGVQELRIKSDAIPGQQSETWFVAEEPGNYTAECFELCGSGHAAMKGEVIVMEEKEFQEWYENTEGSTADSGSDGNSSEDDEGDHS